MTTKLHPGLAKSPRHSAECEARGRFIRARRELGPQQAVAIRLGVGRRTIEDWERGAARVPAWALVALEAMVAKREGRAA